MTGEIHIKKLSTVSHETVSIELDCVSKTLEIVSVSHDRYPVSITLTPKEIEWLSETLLYMHNQLLESEKLPENNNA